jgi:hypothetical protein
MVQFASILLKFGLNYHLQQLLIKLPMAFFNLIQQEKNARGKLYETGSFDN